MSLNLKQILAQARKLAGLSLTLAVSLCFSSAFSAKLPIPTHTYKPHKTLTLHDAVWLALRNNPDVINAELQRVTDKFALEVAHNAFEPHFDLQGTANYNHGTKPVYGVTPSASLQTKWGTQLNTSYSNNLNGKGGISAVSVTQPLLRGFGFTVNEAPLENAKDAALQARWAFYNSIATVIDTVVQQYMQVVSAHSNLLAQQRSLQQSKTLLRQDHLRLKAGKIAPSDVLEQESNVSSAQLSLAQTQNSLHQAYVTLMYTLGLSPTSNLVLDTNIQHVESTEIPSLKAATKIALQHSSAYKTAQLQVRIAQRNIVLAENADEWQLNATATKTIGKGSSSASLRNPFSSVLQPDVGLTLDVPIDNMSNKQAIVAAKIALQQAKQALIKAKQNLLSQLTSEVESLHNQKVQISLAQTNVALQQKTLAAKMIEYKYGKLTIFELNQQRSESLNSVQSLIDARIAMINGFLQLHQLMGVTLQKWQVKLRY